MKEDTYRLERIYVICEQLLTVVKQKPITREMVLNDLETQWLITTPLFNIGEQANCLSQEFCADHPDVPWSQIAGLRHRLAHNYEGTNWNIICSVLFDELPKLVSQIGKIQKESSIYDAIMRGMEDCQNDRVMPLSQAMEEARRIRSEQRSSNKE